MATPPVFAAFPPAPNRGDAPADFSAKADTFVAALPPFALKMNTAISWMAETMATAGQYKDAAAQSATDAAGSATLAGQQVGLAAEQVDLAVAAKNAAAASEAAALASAQAAGAAIGPTPVPLRFLGTDAAGVVDWRQVVIPLSFVTGDILDSSRALAAPDWLKCDGSLYLKASYPALFAEIGQAYTPFNPGLKLANPATLPSAQGVCTSFTREGAYLAIATQSGIDIYKMSSGAPVKLAGVDTAPTGTVNGLAFSPDGTHLVAAHDTTPYVTVYKRSVDAFNKIDSPTYLPDGIGRSVSFSGDSQYMSVTSQGSRTLIIYKRAGDVFAKITGPDVLPGSCYSANFSEDGIYLSAASTSTPYVLFYKRSGDTIVKLANPASLPASQIFWSSLSPDGNYCVAGQNAGISHLYKRTEDAFVQVFTMPGQSSGLTGLSWNSNSTILQISTVGSPYARLMLRTSDTLVAGGTLDTLPTGAAGVAAFSWDNKFLAVPHTTTPLLTIYKAAPYDLATYFQVPTLTHPGTFANINRFIKT